MSRRTILDHTPDGLKRRIADLERQVSDLSRKGTPAPSYAERREDEVSWSTGSSVAVAVGDRKTFVRPVRVSEFRMDLKGTISGTYTARLLKNGAAVADSTISRTAAGSSYVALALAVAPRPTDYIEAEITAVGSGATGMTLTVVYA